MADIKAAAWADMEASGSTECSLRGVARTMGMAPSAIYRYFPSRDDLLSTLIVDSFDDLTRALQQAHRRTREVSPPLIGGEVFVWVAVAYRRWALDHRLAYELIFGNPVGGYVGTGQTTNASLRSTTVLLDVMTELVAAGVLDQERVGRTLTDASRRRFEEWSQTLPSPLPAPALAAAITCYAALHGALALETNRHLPPMLADSDDVFITIMRHTVAAILR